MSSWSKIVHQVEVRAEDRCESCRMHQALQGGTFHVEHILPNARGGPSTLGQAEELFGLFPPRLQAPAAGDIPN